MPQFDDMDSGEDTNFADVMQASPQQMSQAAKMTASRPNTGWFGTLVGDAAFGAMDLVDTVASSIPGLSRAAGIERGTINAKMLHAVDMPGLTEFYNRNKSGIEVASGLEGAIATSMAVGRVLKAAAPLVGTLSKMPGAGRLLSLDTKYAEAMQTVRQVDTSLAATGITGGEAWTATHLVRNGVVSELGPSVGNIFSTTRKAAVLKATGLAFGKGAARAALDEAAMATFLNQNQFLYSDNVGQNMMWMGLGVGLGGTFSAFGSAYQMRKFVNSDAMRRLRANALDPTGMEAARTEVATLGGKQASWLGHLQGWSTDRVTSMMTSAKAALPEGVDGTVFNRMASQHTQQAMEELTKLTARGLPGQVGTGFGNKASGFWNHISGALKKDAGLVYGAEMAGAIPEELTIMGTHSDLVGRAEARFGELDSMLDEHMAGKKVMKSKTLAAVQTEMRQLKFQLEDLTPMVLIDNELMPMSHGQIYDNWLEPEIKSSKSTDDARLFEAFGQDGKGFKVGIDSTGDITLPKRKGALGTIDDADYFDVLRLYRSSQHLITDMAKRVGDVNFSFDIPFKKNGKNLKADWFQLDLAEELMQRTGGRANVNWGTLTRESAQKESLIQKIMALKGQITDETDAAAMSKLRVRYNLPRLNSYQMGVLGTEAHPLDMILRGASSMSEDELRAMSLGDLKQGVAEVNNIGDLAKMTATDVKGFTGNSFKFMTDSDGAVTKPILMYKRNIAPLDWAPDRLAERIGAKKTAQAALLTGMDAAPLTKNLTQGILESPDYRLGAQTTSLMDSQIAGMIPGLNTIASNTGTGSILNSVVTAEWRARDNPVILAITRLRETVDRQMRGFMRTSVETAMGDQLTVLNGPRNLSSKTLLDNFHTFRSGWDLEKNVVDNGQGLSSFVLADTQGNKARFMQQFGREMPKGQTLLDSRGKEVVLDQLGVDIQKRYNALTTSIRQEKNTILRSQGLPEITHTEWYVSSPSLQGKYVGFTFDVNGNIVPGGTVVAATENAFQRELSRMRNDPKSALNTVAGAAFRNRDEIAEYSTIWDRAQMEMLDPGTTAIQGAKESGGFLTGAYTNVNRFDDSMRGLRDSYLKHGNDLMEVMLDDQIKAAKARSNIAGGVTRNADSKQIKYRSIYDYWLEAAQGRSPLSSNGSAVGWLYNGAEARVDDVLREATPTANRVYAAVTDWLTKRVPWTSDARSKEQFTKLTEKLGQHMPFESAADMIERRGLGANPVKLADITGAGNRFDATWVLRILEPAAALMNLAGVVNSLPSVIRHVSAKEGETAADVAARIGHAANIFESPDGRVFSSVDMGKIMHNGFKRAWSREADAEFDYMAKNGFLSQEVAEFQKQFNAVEDKSSLMRFLTGDPTSKSAFAKKGLVGWMSILTDKSEDFSRSWGHMAGLEVADMMGITDKVAKHNFAHDLANKMIANYSPHNRPEIFQGAIGAPIGLFQSFMWNYYQRMFRYIETGDGRAIATQYAVQSSLFGLKSVPGFSELNNLFFENSDGKTSPYDALYAKFGQAGGDMLMAGTLSNLPKLFGAPAVDLVSRGDVSPRIITNGNPITNSASISSFTKVMSGIAQGIHLFSSENPDLNSQQIGEVLSNMMPNRPIAGFIEQTLAGGYDTDPAGQVVHQTKTWMDATYRMIGLRSLEQSKELEAFYGNKQAQEISSAQQDEFRVAIRGSIRAGNFDSIPKYVETFIQNGGDPRQVRRMLKAAYESATQSRAERQLDNVLHSPTKMHMVDRLLDANVGIGEEAETDDPANVYGVNDPLDSPMPTATEDDNGFENLLP